MRKRCRMNFPGIENAPGLLVCYSIADAYRTAVGTSKGKEAYKDAQEEASRGQGEIDNATNARKESGEVMGRSSQARSGATAADQRRGARAKRRFRYQREMRAVSPSRLLQTGLVLCVFASSLVTFLTLLTPVVVAAAVLSLAGGALLRVPRIAGAAVAAAVIAVLLGGWNVGLKGDNGLVDPFAPIVIFIYLLPQLALIILGAFGGRQIDQRRSVDANTTRR